VKPNVPLGGGKALKEGTGAVAVQRGDTSFIYLLKGSGTTEFYRFNIGTNQWETKNGPPMDKNKGFKNGSGLVYDSDAKRIYVLKGSYNLFYAYDLDANTWDTKDSLPMRQLGSTHKKKVKDGAGLAYHNHVIYALKGGNTNEFWCYKCDSNDWTNLTDIIGDVKRVKGGGALVYAASTDALYAQKGNNTRGFWSYGPLGIADRLPPTASRNTAGDYSLLPTLYSLRIAPNPAVAGFATVRFSLPRPGPATVTVFDIAGRSVFATRSPGHQITGSLSVDLRSLAAGVYLVRLEAEGLTQTQTLVKQR